MKHIADQLPFAGKLTSVAAATATLAAVNPSYSLATIAIQDIKQHAIWYAYAPDLLVYANYGLYVATTLIGLGLAAKLLSPSSQSKPTTKQVLTRLGKMTWDERDLFTNIMITGAIGSGKTSSAIYPLLDQFLSIYSKDTNDPGEAFAKLGGLVMDVKGDFYEALIYKMHIKGRNPVEDLVIITPHNNYPYIEFLDEQGRSWFIVGRGGADATSNELTNLIRNEKLPDPITGEPSLTGLPPTAFTEEKELKAPIVRGGTTTMAQYLKTITFTDVANVNFLGWRPQGSKLRRISHTDVNKEIVYQNDANGKPILVDPPKQLTYHATRYVNNGLTFNICPPALAPVELANRLIAMSKTSSGSKGGGDNSFWDDATRKHLTWVTQMLREIRPQNEVTAIELNRMTVDKDYIKANIAVLDEHIKTYRAESLRASPLDRSRMEGQLEIYQDMYKYFTKEWDGLDEKTKSNLVSTITNVFGSFMQDIKLRDVFCVPSTIRIEETMQTGKIFTLVAPGYEAAARIFGTSIKMEFQKTMLNRVGNPIFNKKRFILFLCDEAQNFVTAGGSDPTSGDESFMALSRQSRVCNVIATQSDDSIINVIGEKPGTVYYQQFGTRIYYQNTNEKTNKTAEFLLGTVKKEKASKSGQDIQLATILSKDSTSRGFSESISIEEKKRYPAELFPNLDIHECVIYNKAKSGAAAKSCRNKVPPDDIGSEAGTVAKNKVVLWYFRTYIENQLFRRNEQHFLDNTFKTEDLKVAEPSFSDDTDVATLAPKPVDPLITEDLGSSHSTAHPPLSKVVTTKTTPPVKTAPSTVKPTIATTPTAPKTVTPSTTTPKAAPAASKADSWDTETNIDAVNALTADEIFATTTHRAQVIPDVTEVTKPISLPTAPVSSEIITDITEEERKDVLERIKTGKYTDRFKTFVALIEAHTAATYDTELTDLDILTEALDKSPSDIPKPVPAPHPTAGFRHGSVVVEPSEELAELVNASQEKPAPTPTPQGFRLSSKATSEPKQPEPTLPEPDEDLPPLADKLILPNDDANLF